MSNTIESLRSALFETLQAVKSGSMDIDRAQAICEISQTIINTAKVEIDYAHKTGANVASQFIEAPRQQLTGTPPATPGIADQIEAANRSK